ncbi:hypothetical protein B0H21DRAFT_146468 [Amylocystis lapponica]|nr:hypothetical protein B0H21DRAFT_146468 [Amylocystis lapponica]
MIMHCSLISDLCALVTRFILGTNAAPDAPLSSHTHMTMDLSQICRRRRSASQYGLREPKARSSRQTPPCIQEASYLLEYPICVSNDRLLVALESYVLKTME